MTRAGELAVRTALGASRARLVAQLYLEALALALVGALVGLVVSAVTLRYIQSIAREAGGVPFWIRFDLSPATAVNALVLAALAALIVGIVPGLKATGRRVTAALRGFDGRTGPRSGRVWTTMVGAQVAAAVAVLPVACFDAHKFIVTRIGLPDDDGPADQRKVAEDLRQLMTNLRAEPGVAAVTFSTHVPGFAGGAQIEFEEHTPVAAPAPWYITFNAGDTGGAHTVVVNQNFTKWLPAGVNPLGARFRYVNDSGRGTADPGAI